MSQIISKNIIKLMMSSLACCNYVILCFWGQSPTVYQLFTFRGIKLKFGGEVNSETPISYFMSILPYKMNLIKIKGFNIIFYQIYSNSVLIKVLPW